jgi:hypothetical protein
MKVKAATGLYTGHESSPEKLSLILFKEFTIEP